MKKILFGLTLIIFGVAFELYLQEGWCNVISSLTGLCFAIWGLVSKD